MKGIGTKAQCSKMSKKVQFWVDELVGVKVRNMKMDFNTGGT